MRRNRWVSAGGAALVAAGVAVAAAVVGTSAGSAAPEQRQFRAALVSDVGRFNDRGFNQFQLVGLQRARRQLGIQVRAIESRAASDYIPNLAGPARDGFQFVHAAGFLMASALNTVAERFPNTRFGITDYSVRTPPFSGERPGPSRLRNVVGQVYRTEQNSYLVGCLAALMARRQGGRVISVVGGQKIPPVDDFIVGYRAGARRCVRNITVRVNYSETFIEADRCKSLALNQIAAGSRVVFNVAGPCGFGTLDAAKERRVWGIGVDTDQSFLGSHILTSAVKRLDLGLFRIARDARNNRYRGGRDYLFNLRNNGVSVGKINRRVPRAFVRRINTLKRQIIRGRIRVPRATG